MLRCIRSEPEDAQPDLARNILLTGGNTVLQGYCSRLQRELAALSDGLLESPVSIKGSRFGGRVDAWVGAAMFGAERHFEALCISKAMYDEFGVEISHRMCL